MSFPEKNWLGMKKGWKDLGEVEGTDPRVIKYGYVVRMYDAHSLCRTNIHIGREGGKIFKFCPRCLVKMKPME